LTRKRVTTLLCWLACFAAAAAVAWVVLT